MSERIKLTWELFFKDMVENQMTFSKKKDNSDVAKVTHRIICLLSLNVILTGLILPEHNI